VQKFLICIYFLFTFGMLSKFYLFKISMVTLDSQGSWIALDKPFIARDSDCGIETTAGICLEYGSATRLYCVPYVYREEQVSH
jgi:hypothetical protein